MLIFKLPGLYVLLDTITGHTGMLIARAKPSIIFVQQRAMLLTNSMEKQLHEPRFVAHPYFLSKMSNQNQTLILLTLVD